MTEGLTHWLTRRILIPPELPSLYLPNFCYKHMKFSSHLLYILITEGMHLSPLDFSFMKWLKVLVVQWIPTLCDPMDCSPPGSSVHGILQARILEWVAMPSSRGSSQPGIEPGSPALQADSLPAEPAGEPTEWKKPLNYSPGDKFIVFSLPH